MKRGTPEHPKTKRLARALGIGRAQAVGHLELLWHFTARYAPRGDIGRFPDEEIEDGCDWTGTPGALVAALIECRWLDTCDAHRIVVHGWHEHADDTTKKRWIRDKLGAVHEHGEKCPDMSGQKTPACALPEPEPEPEPDEERAAAAAPKRPRSRVEKSAAPDDLTSEEKIALRAWVRAKHPAEEPRLREHVDACLDHHRARGNRMTSWELACRSWIRNAVRFGRSANGARAAPQRSGVVPDAAETAANLARIRAEYEASLKAERDQDARH